MLIDILGHHSLSLFSWNYLTTVVFAGKVSEGDARSSSRNTSAQNRPFIAIPRNSVTRTRPPSSPANTTLTAATVSVVVRHSPPVFLSIVSLLCFVISFIFFCFLFYIFLPALLLHEDLYKSARSVQTSITAVLTLTITLTYVVSPEQAMGR